MIFHAVVCLGVFNIEMRRTYLYEMSQFLCWVFSDDDELKLMIFGLDVRFADFLRYRLYLIVD